MLKAFAISWFVGETVPILLLLTYKYLPPSTETDFLKLVLWPFSLSLLLTNGNAGAPEADQVRAIAILLNALLYAVIGTFVWFLFFRKRRKGEAAARHGSR